MEKTLKKLVKMGISKIPSTPATMPGSAGPMTGARNSSRGYTSKVSGHSQSRNSKIETNSSHN